jgi:hypothetical protein
MKPSFIIGIFDDCLIPTADGQMFCLINPNDKSVLDFFRTRSDAWIYFDKWCERYLNCRWVDDESCLQSSLCEGLF